MEEDGENDSENDKKSQSLIDYKWATITALGMGGLLAVIWYVSVWARP